MTHWKVYVYTNDFSTTLEATWNGVRVGHLTKRESQQFGDRHFSLTKLSERITGNLFLLILHLSKFKNISTQVQTIWIAKENPLNGSFWSKTVPLLQRPDLFTTLLAKFLSSIQPNSRPISFKIHYVQLFPSLLKIKLHNAFKHNTTIIQEIIISIKFLDNVNQISEIQACMVINMIYFLCI